MGLLSKLKGLFNTSSEKSFVFPTHWTQEELKNYFKEGLDHLYHFCSSNHPKAGLGDHLVLIVQIYQSLILENEFKLKHLDSYDSQEIKTVGLLYGLDNLYDMTSYNNFIDSLNINPELINSTLRSNRLHNALAKNALYIAEFIVAYTFNKKSTIQEMNKNPDIDKFFNRYLLDTGRLNRNDPLPLLATDMEHYAREIKYYLDYLVKKCDNINL